MNLFLVDSWTQQFAHFISFVLFIYRIVFSLLIQVQQRTIILAQKNLRFSDFLFSFLYTL